MKQVGKPDLIFEATGNAEVCFRAMEVLAHQRGPDLDEHHRRQARGHRRRREDQPRMGAGQQAARLERQRQPPALRAGIQALSHGELTYPGVTERILTHPVAGLDHYKEMMRLLEDKEALKVFVNVAE